MLFELLLSRSPGAKEPEGILAAAFGLLLLRVGEKNEVRGVEIAGLIPGLIVPEAELPDDGPRYI